MVERTIIANYGDPNLGKSESVKLVYEKLHKVADAIRVLHAPDPVDADICAILTINYIKVGISSQGDPWSKQKYWLDQLVHNGCRIIVTACRYGGVTMTNVESYAPAYRIWWSCNARLYERGSRKAPKSMQTCFNEQWAEEIAKMIESWCYA